MSVSVSVNPDLSITVEVSMPNNQGSYTVGMDPVTEEYSITNVQDKNGRSIDGNFATAADAQAAISARNSEITSNTFFSLLGLVFSIVCSACSLALAAISVVSTVVSAIANKENPVEAVANSLVNGFIDTALSLATLGGKVNSALANAAPAAPPSTTASLGDRLGTMKEALVNTISPPGSSVTSRDNSAVNSQGVPNLS